MRKRGNSQSEEYSNSLEQPIVVKIQKIDDTLFKEIYGKSYKTNCTVPKEELR